MLDDGTAGLMAIKRCGGVTVVQNPRDAAYSGMPVGLIRFRGHFPKGGYDVHTDGRDDQEPAVTPAVR
jgi:chemotaxis response regulator CheB